jgi:hypothetical protein
VDEQALARLQARLEAFLAAARDAEVSEDGERVLDLAEAEWRVEPAHGKLLLHILSPRRTWTRRVLEIIEESPERLVARVERFGRRPGRLVVAPAPRRSLSAAPRAARRRDFAAWLRRLGEREFPRARLEGLTTAPDLKRSFSPVYARARLAEANRWWAVLGVNADEGASAVDAALTFGLVWLDWNRRRYPDRVWAGLRLFLPAGRTATTANRLAALAGASFELFAVDELRASCARLDPGDVGNLRSELLPRRQTEELLENARSTCARFLPSSRDAIQLSVVAGRAEVSARFRGLEFARVVGEELRFGAGPKLERLTEKNFGKLKALVARLARERKPGGPARSALYRAQPERWLESLALASPQALDPRLDPANVYAQVPAVTAGERGLADLLGATRAGRLVVIELKASADIHLPLQALDYWLAVRWHQQRSQFARLGYFPGVTLRPEPPELLLAAPALEFHPATDALLSYWKREIRATIIGLSEDWRRELRVVSRRGREALPVEE